MRAAQAWWASGASAQTAAPNAANDNMLTEIKALRAEVARLRAENNAGHAATAGNTGRSARKLEAASSASGGDAFAVVASVG